MTTYKSNIALKRVNLMDFKSLLVLVVLVMLNICVMAQASWESLKKKAQETADQARQNKTISHIHSKINKQIIEEINEKYHLDDLYYSVNIKLAELNKYQTINCKLGELNPKLYRDAFSNQPQKPDIANLMNFIRIKAYNEPVIIDNHSYILFEADNKTYFLNAIGLKKSPIGEELYFAILETYYREELKTINSDYFVKLLEFTNALKEAYKTLLDFFNTAIKIFDQVDHLEYMNVTAEDVLNIYLEQAAYGLTFDDIYQTMQIVRDKLSESNKTITGINKNVEQIQANIDKINTGQEISMLDMQRSLNGFSQVSDSINAIADDVNRNLLFINNNQNKLNLLSNFYDITFFESIGSLHKILGEYLKNIEAGIRTYANQFAAFKRGIYDETDKMYNKSIKELKISMIRQYKNNHTVVYKLVKINNDINEERWHKSLRISSPINEYIDRIEADDNQVIEYMNKDVYLFLSSKQGISEMIDEMPINKLEDFYKKVIAKINNEQIIGGLNQEMAYRPFYQTLSSINKNKYDLKQYDRLETENNKIDVYYKNARSKNTRFYFATVLIIISIIVTVVIIVNKR